MKIGEFVGALNAVVVLQYLKVLAQLFAYLFVVPLVVAVLARDWLFALIFLAITVSLFVLALLRRNHNLETLQLREALVITAIGYLFFALAGSISFLPISSFEDAFFEAMSAITTTGLSVLNVTELPASLVFFRSYSQWLGGLGVVVLTLTVLNHSGRSASKLYSSEGGRENIRGNLLSSTRMIMAIYGGLTAAAFIVYGLVGMPWFDALTHALSTLSTGGFSSRVSSIGSYSSSLLNAVVTLFMMLGSVSFTLFYLSGQVDLKRFILDRQIQLLVALLFGFGVLFWLLGPLTFSESLFQVGSALSTSGFEVVTTANLPESILFLTTLLMMTGGSVGSTAGGLKLLRLLLFFGIASWVLQKLHLPDEVKLPQRVNKVPLSEKDMHFALVYFLLYLFFATFSIFMFMLAGFSLMPSLFESISALSTVGLSAGITSSSLPLGLKLLLCFDMWIGRLEILPVLILLSPFNWRLSIQKQRS